MIVTGGSGFIGTTLVRALIESGHAVLNIDAASPRDPHFSRCWASVDLLDSDRLAEAFKAFGPTHVIHLAARTDLRGTHVQDYQANTAGIESLLAACHAAGPELQRVVFASSRLVCRIGYEPSSEYDVCPSTPYGESKVHGERLVREAPLPFSWTIVRLTSIWGPWFDEPYRDFFEALMRGRYLHPKGERVLKSFGYVENTASQLMGLLDAEATAKLDRTTIYVGDDPPLEVLEWATAIRTAIGARPPYSVPVWMLRVIARIGDGLESAGRRAPLTTFRLANLRTPMVHDVSEAKRYAAVPPVPMPLAIDRTLTWMGTSKSSPKAN